MNDDNDTRDRSEEQSQCDLLAHGHVCAGCNTAWFIYEIECDGRCPDCGDYFVQ